MLALMIPKSGLPFFSLVDDERRGYYVSTAVATRKDGSVPGVLESFDDIRFELLTFNWTGQFSNSTGRLLFDIFEER